MRNPSRRPRTAIALVAAVALAATASHGLPGPARGQAQPAPAPTPFSRFVPAKGLVLYAECDGADAHAEGWRRTAAAGLLNETTVGKLIDELFAQWVEQVPRGPNVPKPDGAQAATLARSVLRRGFAFALNRVEGEGQPNRLTLVLRGGARPEMRQTLDRLILASVERAVVEKAGRSVTRMWAVAVPVYVWDERGDLVITQDADAALAALDGKAPDAGTVPALAGLRAPDGETETVLRAFYETGGFPTLPPQAAGLGLDGLSRVELRWGFQGESLATTLRLVAPTPRRGLLALFDQPTFDVKTLPPVPAGAVGFTAVSVNFAAVYDRVLGMALSVNKDAVQQIIEAEAGMRAALGFDPRTELLPHLGPKFSFYAMPRPSGGGGGEKTADGGLDVVLDLPIDDAQAVGRSVERLVAALNAAVAGDQPGGQKPPAYALEKVEAPRPTYLLRTRGPLPPGLSPALIVADGRLVVATRREAAEAAADFKPGPAGAGVLSPAGRFAAAAETLPAGLIALNLNRPGPEFRGMLVEVESLLRGLGSFAPGLLPRNSIQRFKARPELIPPAEDLARRLGPGSFALAVDDSGVVATSRVAFFGVTSPVVTGALVKYAAPFTSPAGEAAQRAQCVNNLKQLGLALHNHHAAHNEFPGLAITDKQGKPLLSWRVAILPMLGLGDLYNKFKLDEPWDGPSNIKLLAEMPAVFACPSTPQADPTLTTYQAFAGADGLMAPVNGKNVTLADVTDGTSNTIAVVEAKAGVPWTKPDDLPLPADDLTGAEALKRVGSTHPGGFNVLFADGSVRFLKSTINSVVFRALATRSAGEVINADAH